MITSPAVWAIFSMHVYNLMQEIKNVIIIMIITNETLFKEPYDSLRKGEVVTLALDSS